MIGAVRCLVTKKCSGEKATGIVAKALINHWWVRNVYPKADEAVEPKMLREYKEFMVVRKLIKSLLKKPSMYAVLQGEKDKMYDIFRGSTSKLNEHIKM